MPQWITAVSSPPISISCARQTMFVSTSRSVLASPPRIATAASPSAEANISPTLAPFARSCARPPKRPAEPFGDALARKIRFSSTLRASIFACAVGTSCVASSVMLLTT